MQLKNRQLEVLELVALFLLKTETCDAKNSWEFFVDNIFCLVFLKDRFRKERDKYKVSLINRRSLILHRIQHKGVLFLVLRTVSAACFWLLSFLQLKLWARIRIPLQIEDCNFPLFVSQLSKMGSRCILRLNLTSYLCIESYGHDWLQTCR